MNSSPAHRPTVVILGASADRSKFGNKSLRAHLQGGYQVFPVNPKGGEIEGLTVFRSLSDVPARPSRISVYLPPRVGLEVLPDIARLGCDELWLNPGSDSAELVENARALGLRPIMGCSIVDLGFSPADFPG
jgi:predicted CoA-binding protein